jgi:hypothetical protein
MRVMIEKVGHNENGSDRSTLHFLLFQNQTVVKESRLYAARFQLGSMNFNPMIIP